MTSLSTPRRHRDHGLEIARLHVVWVAGEPRLNLVERELGEERHAVEALLPVHGDVVAELLELEPREGVVDAFDLLQKAMSGEAALSQVRAASMRALMPLMFQVAIFMGEC